MVATVYGVAVSCRGVVVKHREIFVETGSSPVEMLCHSLDLLMVLLKVVELRLLTCVVSLNSLQVEYIDVILQLMPVNLQQSRHSMWEYMLMEVCTVEHVYILHHIDTGDVRIPGEVTFDSVEMTLTCISTGGPATTVTWTRDSITVTEGTETVLDDRETAQYTHTLTVTTGGEYTCNVSNNKPSSDSATITVPGIVNVHILYRNERNEICANCIFQTRLN